MRVTRDCVSCFQEFERIERGALMLPGGESWKSPEAIERREHCDDCIRVVEELLAPLGPDEMAPSSRVVWFGAPLASIAVTFALTEDGPSHFLGIGVDYESICVELHEAGRLAYVLRKWADHQRTEELKARVAEQEKAKVLKAHVKPS